MQRVDMHHLPKYRDNWSTRYDELMFYKMAAMTPLFLFFGGI